jgi:hypothetical protein
VYGITRWVVLVTAAAYVQRKSCLQGSIVPGCWLPIQRVATATLYHFAFMAKIHPVQHNEQEQPWAQAMLEDLENFSDAG